MRLPEPITSRTNTKVKALRAAFAGRASCSGELTAVEGEHLLTEIARAGIPLRTLFVRQGDEAVLESAWARTLHVEDVLVLSREVFHSVVETATPQGIAGTLEVPAGERAEKQHPGPVLLLENVQDPGNVGTLIRSAAAFGAAEVLLVGACANPWSPKVLRSSAGAAFSVPVHRLGLAEAVRTARGTRKVVAAVAGGSDVTSAIAADLKRPLLMVGNEGKGLTREALQLAEERVSIPCRIESFNAAVAGSLLLYESFRQIGGGAL